MFQKILVPVDFTKKNAASIKIACNLAKQSKGKIILVHVIEKIEQISDEDLKDFYCRLEDFAREKLQKISRNVSRQKIVVESILLWGNRAAEIVRYAEENAVDLILMSSHRLVPGENSGTLSYQVALFCPCSILLVK